MARGPFGGKRITSLGPLVEKGITTDSEVAEIAGKMLLGTPAKLKTAEYQDYFSDPNCYIGFTLPSKYSFTEDRDMGTSIIIFTPDTVKLSELSIRFPRVLDSVTDLKTITTVLDGIVDNAGTTTDFRTRIDHIKEDGYMHPHLHFTSRRTGILGKDMSVVGRDVNAVIREWYKVMDTEPFN